MTIYYDKENKCFYDSEINEIIPEGSIEITPDQYNALLEAINDGCIIFDDLTYSESKPSRFHSWDGDKWVEDVAEKNSNLINNNKIQQQKLLSEATQQVSILQDAIDAEIETEDEITALASWKKYRILLNRIEVNQLEPEWPIKPD